MIWSMRVLTTATTPQEFFDRHRVRRWHGQQQVFHFKTTRYDAFGRPAQLHRDVPGAVLADHRRAQHLAYRVEGDEGTVGSRGGHRYTSRPAEFPFRKFWSRRLLLVDAPDPEKLGRYLRNRRNGTRDRKPLKENGISIDRRRGGIALSYNSLQETLDRYRSEDVRRVFELLPNDAFLPLE